MKRSISLLLYCAVTALPAVAQDRNTLGIFLGPSLPVGEYAKTGAQDDKSGCAKLGAIGEIFFDHPIKESGFGLEASLRARWNPINTSAILDPLKESNPGFTWQSNKTSWKSAAFLVGGYRNFSLAGMPHWSFGVHVLLGASESELPATRIVGYGSNPSFGGEEDAIFVSNKKVYSTAFSGAARIGGSLPLTKRLYYFTYLDFWYSRPTFKNVQTLYVYAQNLVIPGTLSPTNATSITENSYTGNVTQPMNSLNLLLGLGLRL